MYQWMCTYVARIFIWLWNCLSMSYSMIEEKVLVKPFFTYFNDSMRMRFWLVLFSLRFSKIMLELPAFPCEVNVRNSNQFRYSLNVLRFSLMDFFSSALSYSCVPFQSQSICDQLLTIDVRVNIYCWTSIGCLRFQTWVLLHRNTQISTHNSALVRSHTHTPKYRNFKSISRIKVGISTLYVFWTK